MKKVKTHSQQTLTERLRGGTSSSQSQGWAAGGFAQL